MLDICLTDLGAYYEKPEIRKPVEPNDKNRVPSDHSPWFTKPHTDSSTNIKREIIMKTVRPFTEDSKKKLATLLQSESWEYVYDGRTSMRLSGLISIMIQSKYNNKNNTIFMGFDSIEINLLMATTAPRYSQAVPVHQ